MPGHRRIRFVCAAAALFVALGSAACSRAPEPGRIEAISAEPPPPEPHIQRATRAPHPGWVWVAGYWNLVNGRHVWVPGFWTVPPSGMHRWQPAYWYHDKNQGWVLVKGYWR